MAIPQLKAFDCIDHDPIEEWTPESDVKVFYSLCLHIGPPDGEGADLFYVDVVTPQAMEGHGLQEHLSARKIVISPYSWEAVLKSVQVILNLCAGENWDHQSALLAKHFDWEFANYRS